MITQRVADASAATSVGGALWIHLAHVNEVLQAVAACIAIVSGVFAACYHGWNLLQKWRARVR